MKNLTKYVINGLQTENNELFIKRVAEIVEFKNCLEVLTEGVPVGVEIFDERELFECFKKRYPESNPIRVKSTEIDRGFIPTVIIEYSTTRFYKSQEDADNESYSYKNERTDDYNYEKEVILSTCIQIREKLEGVKIIKI